MYRIEGYDKDNDVYEELSCPQDEDLWYVWVSLYRAFLSDGILKSRKGEPFDWLEVFEDSVKTVVPPYKIDETESAAVYFQIIAKDVLVNNNRARWNGLGDKPKGFNAEPRTYPLPNKETMTVCFEYTEEDGWVHRCEIDDGQHVFSLHGYGVDSFWNLVDTMEDLYYNR